MSDKSMMSQQMGYTNIRRRSYSGDFKAKVVSELILGKSDLQKLAMEYDLHPNLIKNWKSTLLKRADEVLDDKRRKR